MNNRGELLYLIVEVAGCPTVCMHCWALGRDYRAMPVEQAAFVLERAHRSCEERGLRFATYPMHEVAAHPQAAEMIRLFHSHWPGEFQPLSTTGVPLAVHADWRELLATLRELGTTTIWPALHGVGGEHDRQVNRAGAYAETCLAVERAHAAGLRVGCNVFLTKANLASFDALLAELDRIGIDEASFEPATYYPSRRSRRYAAGQPELADLLPVAERVLRRTPFWRDRWSTLAAYTEASYRARALAGEWRDEPKPGLRLVCRPNLDLHTGNAGLYGKRHGNLGKDDPDEVLARALAHGAVTDEVLYLPGFKAPPLRKLAERHSNPQGQEVHFFDFSMRNRWLHRAWAARARDRDSAAPAAS